MILPISGGSSLEFETKRQRRYYIRRVHSIVQNNPVIKTHWSHAPITFSKKDLNLRCFQHTDAMVISANISGWMVTKILVDNGSSANIIFASTFEKNEHRQKIASTCGDSSDGFRGKKSRSSGKNISTNIFWHHREPRTEHITCDVVDTQYPYNFILGRGFLNKVEAIVYQAYLCMKMSVAKGIISIHGDQQKAQDIERGITPCQKNVHYIEPLTNQKPEGKGKTQTLETKDSRIFCIDLNPT